MLDAAIIGLGRWGRVLVSSVQGKSDRIRFVRGVTRRPALAEDFAREQGFSVDDDYPAALADPAVGAVVLATPHSRHVEQVEQAAAAGKHVLVEKPFALEHAGAAQAVAACEAAGVILGVAHNRRFLPAVARLKEIVADGTLGDILHLEGNMSGPSGKRFLTSTWRGAIGESPGGGMTGKGIHVIDAMIHLLGPIVEVDARSLQLATTGELDDTTVMLLRFATGATGYLATLTATADLWRLRVFGTRGWAEMRGETTLAVLMLEKSEEDVIQFDPFDTERAELEAFAAAIAGGAPFPVPNDEVLANVAVLEAVSESARTESSVKIQV
jgi:predicted dehydrogenase